MVLQVGATAHSRDSEAAREAAAQAAAGRVPPWAMEDTTGRRSVLGAACLAPAAALMNLALAPPSPANAAPAVATGTVAAGPRTETRPQYTVEQVTPKISPAGVLSDRCVCTSYILPACMMSKCTDMHHHPANPQTGLPETKSHICVEQPKSSNTSLNRCLCLDPPTHCQSLTVLHSNAHPHDTPSLTLQRTHACSPTLALG